MHPLELRQPIPLKRIAMPALRGWAIVVGSGFVAHLFWPLIITITRRIAKVRIVRILAVPKRSPPPVAHIPAVSILHSAMDLCDLSKIRLQLLRGDHWRPEMVEKFCRQTPTEDLPELSFKAFQINQPQPPFRIQNRIFLKS